jgi:hypothetical protein
VNLDRVGPRIAERRSGRTAGRLRRAMDCQFGLIHRVVDLPTLVGDIVWRLMGGWIRRIVLMTVMLLMMASWHHNACSK